MTSASSVPAHTPICTNDACARDSKLPVSEVNEARRAPIAADAPECATSGVLVPAELCRPLARAAIVGLAVIAHKDGGLMPTPGMAALLAKLTMSSERHPSDSMGHEITPLTGSEWLTVSEAAERTGLSRRSVQRLAGGRLRARRVGRSWLIDPDSAEDYARERGAVA
jgi:excisionase family DNA binding protein